MSLGTPLVRVRIAGSRVRAGSCKRIHARPRASADLNPSGDLECINREDECADSQHEAQGDNGQGKFRQHASKTPGLSFSFKSKLGHYEIQIRPLRHKTGQYRNLSETGPPGMKRGGPELWQPGTEAPRPCSHTAILHSLSTAEEKRISDEA